MINYQIALWKRWWALMLAVTSVLLFRHDSRLCHPVDLA